MLGNEADKRHEMEEVVHDFPKIKDQKKIAQEFDLKKKKQTQDQKDVETKKLRKHSPRAAVSKERANNSPVRQKTVIKVEATEEISNEDFPDTTLQESKQKLNGLGALTGQQSKLQIALEN